MKKIIMVLFLSVAGSLFAQAIYTKTTRIDSTNTAGVTYVGKAAVNASAVKAMSTNAIETNACWTIQKITDTAIYSSGGDTNYFGFKWSDRASSNTNAIWYK